MNKRAFIIVLSLFFLQRLAAQDTTLSFKPFCLSAGIGIPYGGYGLNIEICPIEFIGINVGLGDNGNSTSSNAEIKDIIGYAIGLRVYALSQKSVVRPFIMVNYGTVAKSQKKTIYSSNGIPLDWSGLYKGPTSVEGTAISIGIRIYNYDLGVTVKKVFELSKDADEYKNSIPLNVFLIAIAFYF